MHKEIIFIHSSILLARKNGFKHVGTLPPLKLSGKCIWLDKLVIKISKQKCHFVNLFCGINDSEVSH